LELAWFTRKRELLSRGGGHIRGPKGIAWNGLPLERYMIGVHPEDRAYFSRLIDRAMQNGGPFVAQYRTLDEVGTTRLIVDRGEFELGPSGRAVAARGVVVDMTDRPRGMKIDGDLSRTPTFSDLPPLHQAVEHALALHKLIDVLPEGWRHSADMMLRTVLEMLGNEVAASLKRDGYHPVHLRSGTH
jgi:hypothetical protein